MSLRYFGLLIPLFVACELFENEPDPIVDVPVEFRLALFQEIRPDGRELFLEVETVDTFDCRNYAIAGDLTLVARRAVLTVAQIDAPTDCDPGRAPAHRRFSLDGLPVGSSDFVSELRATVRSEGQLLLDTNGARFDFDAPNGIALAPALTFLPETAAWGHVSYPADPAEEVAFLSDLLARSADVLQGNYGYFTTATEPLTFRTPAPGSGFAVTLAVDASELADLVTTYRDRLGDAFAVRIRLGDGSLLE